MGKGKANHAMRAGLTMLAVLAITVRPGPASAQDGPGVERKLRKRSDFERFAGQKARFVLSEPVEEQRNWEGTLRGIDEAENITVEPSEGRLVRIPLQLVRKANLKFEW